MVDDLKSTEPDDPHFVLPARMPDESVRDYTARIESATDAVKQHPNINT